MFFREKAFLSRLSRAIALIVSFLLLFTETVWAVDPYCYVPLGAIKKTPEFNPRTGFCETPPLDEGETCPEKYVYSPWLKTCVSFPGCSGNYIYDFDTRSCKPQSIDSNATPVNVPRSNVCVIDLNKNGELEPNEIYQCNPTDNEKDMICPYDATPCQPKYTPPICPSGYSFDGELLLCEKEPECSSGLTYNSTAKACTGWVLCSSNSTSNSTGNSTGNSTSLCFVSEAPSCSGGGAFNSGRDKCEAQAICPAGANLTNRGCFMENYCPYGDYPCKPVNGVMMCSAYDCVNQLNVEDEPGEPSDYINDGKTDNMEKCMGQVFIFNGQAKRCRPSGWQTGFHDCCDSKLAKDKIYDSTGSIGVNFTLLKNAVAAIRAAYDIAHFGAWFLSGTTYIYGAEGVFILSRDLSFSSVWVIDKTSFLGQALSDLFSKFDFPIVETPDGLSVFAAAGSAERSLEAMSSCVQFLDISVKMAIVHLALSGIVKDPLTASVLHLVADIIFWQMGWFIGMPTWVLPVTLILDVIGILVVLFMGGCDKEDHMTVTLRESGYCHYVGTRCIKKIKIGFAKICVQKGKFYCCFNSKLARIIHEQGRPQLNTDIRSWGSAKHPNCRGFTPEEFASLDFDKIDLTEYFEDITRNVAKDIEPNVLQFFNDAIQTRVPQSQ